MYCLQARPCVFQPGNVTGFGSEGVKANRLTEDAENRSVKGVKVRVCSIGLTSTRISYNTLRLWLYKENRGFVTHLIQLVHE